MTVSRSSNVSEREDRLLEKKSEMKEGGIVVAIMAEDA